MSPKSKPNEIHLTRVYDAPVETVWEAWTDPAKAAKWWGPRGFTLTTHSKDFRVGGTWRYTMHGPDGTDYPNVTRYLEVEPLARMVYDHGGTDARPPMFRVTVTFAEQKGKTTMEMTMALQTAEEAQKTRKFIKDAGGNGTWDRLAEYLETKKEIFVINRSFDVPIERMYEVWTDPKHIAKWMPPTGFTMEYLRADLRPGGSSFYKMSNGKDVTMYGRAFYHEFAKPHRMVYSQQFCEETGEKVARHPMAPTWPATMRTTITFTEEGADQTRVTIQWEIEGDYTPAELATFVAGKPGMTMGWTGSLDKLEAYL